MHDLRCAWGLSAAFRRVCGIPGTRQDTVPRARSSGRSAQHGVPDHHQINSTHRTLATAPNGRIGREGRDAATRVPGRYWQIVAARRKHGKMQASRETRIIIASLLIGHEFNGREKLPPGVCCTGLGKSQPARRTLLPLRPPFPLFLFTSLHFTHRLCPRLPRPPASPPLASPHPSPLNGTFIVPFDLSDEQSPN